jgi:hypothetical protein
MAEEKKERKLSVLRFLDNWRQFVEKGYLKYAEGYFMGAWSTQNDDWCAELQHQMTKKEKKLVMKYPIYL